MKCKQFLQTLKEQLTSYGKEENRIAKSILNIKESTSASQLHRAKAILADKIRKYQTLTPYAR